MELFKNLNPNILKMFKELFKSSDLIKEFFMQNTLDEYYDFCTKIQSGYTKEELQAFFNDLILLAKKSEGGKIELDEELEQVCGGVDIKNFNRKFLSTFLSALTLSEAFSVDALQNQEKTNQKSMSLPTPLYSRNVTINKKKNQKSKFPEKEETMFNPVLIPVIGIAIGSSIIALSNSDSDSIPAVQFNAGLANTGNTCFSNALLQQLYSIKSFRRFIDSINSLDDIKKYKTDTIFKGLNLKYYKDITKETLPDLMFKKINVFKKIFELMGTVKCVEEKNMIEYVSTALTGHIERKQDDINECFFQFLGDVVGLYQEFLTKGEIKDETKDEKNATPRSHCICGYTLEVPHEPKDWDDNFKSTFPRRFNSAKLYRNVHLNADNFIDRYQQAYMQKYGYTDAVLEISSDSEKDFLEKLYKEKSDKEKLDKEKLEFMQELVKQIAKENRNNLYKKYVFSTIYLKLKQTQLSSQSKERDTIDQRIQIYAAKAFSARQKLSENDLKYELNSIFEVLNKYKDLKFGSIQISDLEQMSDDKVNTKLHNLIYNEVTDLFRECYEKKIIPLDGKDILSPLTENNPNGDITPVDGQIAFFLNRTYYDEESEKNAKSTVEVKFDSKSKYGFEWDYSSKKYVLSAASVHSGKDASFGHYYTYKLEADGNWYKYNDDSVYKTTWKEIKDNIETNGVMFTFTEKSAFEKSMQEYRSSPNTFGINKNKLDCMDADTIETRINSWKQPPTQLPSLEVIQTGEKKPYTGITDQNLLNERIDENKPIAIIDAAKNSAQGGGGVDGAIFKAMAGEKSSVSCIQGKIAEEFPSPSGHRIQTGGCIIHDSFGIKETSLHATHVIQAVGPRINDKNSNKKNWEKELYSAYYNSFVLGIRKGITTFITAPISLGIFCSVTDFDEAKKVGEKAANILLHAINDASKFNKTVGNIEVYVTDHHVDGNPKKAAEDAFIQALYEKFPSQ